LGVGLGGGAVFGAMLHAINHSLTKAMLFFVAGNLLAVYGTKTAGQVRGALRVAPVSAALWLAGFLAIVGSPPFGPFLSEFMVLKGALEQGRYAVAVIYLAALAVIFIGMSAIALNMAQGRSSLSGAPAARREPLLAVVPPAVLGAGVLVLGLYVPPVVSGLVRDAARALGGG
jgi:hydrogenase-4 component F